MVICLTEDSKVFLYEWIFVVEFYDQFEEVLFFSLVVFVYRQNSFHLAILLSDCSCCAVEELLDIELDSTRRTNFQCVNLSPKNIFLRMRKKFSTNF